MSEQSSEYLSEQHYSIIRENFPEYIAVPKAAVFGGISHHAFRLYVILLNRDYADTNGNRKQQVWPSINKLAQDMGMGKMAGKTSRSAIFRALQELEEGGWIRRETRGNQSSVIYINWQPSVPVAKIGHTCRKNDTQKQLEGNKKRGTSLVSLNHPGAANINPSDETSERAAALKEDRDGDRGRRSIDNIAADCRARWGELGERWALRVGRPPTTSEITQLLCLLEDYGEARVLLAWDRAGPRWHSLNYLIPLCEEIAANDREQAADPIYLSPTDYTRHFDATRPVPGSVT